MCAIYTKRIYEQVRELIEADARDKKPGEPLDTEVGYARRFGVSRPTARKAVEDLIRIGMIRRVAGKGLEMATQDETPYRGKILIALPHERLGDGFLFRVTLGCVEQANMLGFDYKIMNSNNTMERIEQVRRERLSDFVAVITCCYEEAAEYETLSLYESAGLPVMLIDNPTKQGQYACVTCNDYDGGYQMGAYLARKGHSRIANISSTRPVLTIERRDNGFIQALSDAGQEYDQSMLTKSGDYITAFAERFNPQDFFSGRITAICSHTSLAIVAVSRWLYQNGIRIYDDVSIIGYGDYPYIPTFEMPFTIVGVPSMEMGKSAVEEISAALLEKRPLKSVQHDVWLEKRHTVRDITLSDAVSGIAR